ncbi:cytochrome P450 [Nocardia cyriacigeorgica]|uniref:Cytochrome P450 n=1 Tax=Nocardia cyriacigeorgica TaxID=135487 RepID=A0A6P1CZA1_9NOCA|nr:cytochrome P450 [Nocardia cyriacigeorgica]NEW40336.1 cytochrome P450 [Nocardia cyriacigeorgica]NEW43465.1 cytochrome P450 [Nocardia cyriacigeorgica]NEW54796.1 cytochrome P450 [Nocardia cyriacigeorgica]
MAAAPSDIDIFDAASLADPYPMYRILRDQAPVYRVPGADFFLVTTWDLVTEAATRTTDFSSNLTGVMIHQPDGAPLVFDMDGGGQAVHVLATADDPVHAVHRKLVFPFIGKRLRELGPLVNRMVDRIWHEELSGNRIDFATGMADRLPLGVVADLIGLPQRDVPQLLAWAYDSTEMLGGIVPEGRLTQLVTSAAELAGYLHQRFTTALTEPEGEITGLLDVLARACRAGDLDPDVAVLMLVQLVGAGGESTAGLIANAAHILATRTDLQDRLRADTTLIPGFLDEVLRVESPFRGHHRHITADSTLGGVALPAGGHLLLMWGAANRDPHNFTDPDTIDLERPTGRTTLAFGKGAHYCIGAALARMEALAAITTLLARSTEFGLVEDAAPQWVPSLMVRRHTSLPLRVRGG